MQKHCNICNRPYPEELAHCPHCAAAGQADSSDAIAVTEEDLDVIEVVEETVTAAETHPSRKNESEPVVPSSDQDVEAFAEAMLAEDSEEELVAEVVPDEESGPSASGEWGSLADLDIPAETPEASAIDLGALSQVQPSDSAASREGDSSSAVNFGKGPPSGEESSISGVELAEDVAEVADVSQAHLDAGKPDSGDTTRVRLPGDEHSPDEIAEVEVSSAVNLGEAPPPPEERPLARDPIAEAVESGVDLGSGAAPEEVSAEMAEEPAEDSAVDLGAAFAMDSASSMNVNKEPAEVEATDAEEPGSSSKVDLGGKARSRSTPEEDEPISETSGIELDDIAASDIELGAGPDSSGVDLGGSTRRTDKGKKTAVASGINLDDIHLEEAAAQAMSDHGEDIGEDVQDESVLLGEDEGAASILGGDEDEDESALAGTVGPAEPRAATREKAPTREKKAGSGKGWLVGTGLGVLLGAGLAVALWFVGIEPPRDWRLASDPPARPPVSNVPVTPVPRADTESGIAAFKSGDFDKALTGLEAAPQPTPEILAKKGAARWMLYLQQQKMQNAPLKSDDPALVQAREDLTSAAQQDSPEAVFYLGQIDEFTAPDLAAAMKTYNEGYKRFSNDPVWERRFRTALYRLQARAAAQPGQPVGWRPGDDPDAAAQALALLTVAFQEPTAGQPEQPTPPGQPNAQESEEGGYKFWEARILAQQGKFSEAITALGEAKAIHDRMRFARLHQPQNPNSDEYEEIFLRACEELATHWHMQAILSGKEGEQLVKQRNPQTTFVARLVQERTEAANKLAEAAKSLTAAEEAKTKALAETKMVRDNLTTVQTKLTEANDKVTTLTKEKDTAAANLETAETKLKQVGTQLVAAGIKTTDLAEGVTKLASARTSAEQTLTEVAKKLKDARVVTDENDRAALVKGVARVIDLAQTKDPEGQLATKQKEIERLKDTLAESRTPAQLLDVWLPVLADRANKEAAIAAVGDAEKAVKSPTAPADVRAKGLAVLGLSLRNLGDFASARKTLDTAVKMADPKAAWRPQAEQVLNELSKPAAFYFPRARDLLADGKTEAAVELLTEGLKAFPDDPALLALRSQARLETAQARAEGKITPATPGVAEAQADAAAAGQAKAAEGYFAAGRIAEELGDLPRAREAYKQALQAHPAQDEAGNRYRIALAQVLLKMQQEKAGTTALPQRSTLPLAEASRDPLVALLRLVTLAFGQEGGSPEVDEATKLADEVLASSEASPLQKAQALGVKGLWSKALQTYAEGVKGKIPSDYAEVLNQIVESHPALKRPDSLAIPDPFLAEAYYMSGLRHYFAGRYPQAEEAFLSAVEANNQDARYFYYLGLTRVGLSKRNDATSDFEQGAQLEALARPSPAVVSRALERVQGDARRTLNQFRP